MSSSTTRTISFYDADAKQEALVIVRAVEQTIGLALSLREDGDIHVFIPLAEARTLLEALQDALAEAAAQGE